MFLKLMGAMPGYIYAQDATGIYVNLFVGSAAKIQLAGQTVRLKQTTGYPWQGDVKITVEPARTGEFDLHLRIPGWCQGAASPDDLYQADHRPADGAAHLKVNGNAVENLKIVRGYATLHRRWKSGDVVQLTLDMPVQHVQANASVEADQGRLALMRGPIVYCFEGVDNGAAVQNLVIPPGTEFTPEYRGDLLGGVTVLTGMATGVFQTGDSQAMPLPFKVTATPYFANANRGTSPMQVWMPEDQSSARPQRQE
jgi:DUF1680 family protein